MTLLSTDASLDESFLASFACRLHSGEITNFTLTHSGTCVQQHIVDAYAAQHSGNKTKPISTAFALIGLYLMLEHGYTGRQVQQAHMALANQTKNWPVFARPPGFATLTVDHVVSREDSGKLAAISDWCRSVWDWWSPAQEEVRQLVSRYRLTQARRPMV